MKKLNNNTRQQIVQEVNQRLHALEAKLDSEYNKLYAKVFKVMLKSPLCYDIGYSAKYQPEEIKDAINRCVTSVASILTRMQIGESIRYLHYGEVQNELALFETTEDFANCEDAYEVIECLYNFFAEKYK